MGKVKTNRGLRKRVKFTSSGKIKRFKAGKSHLLGKKSAKRKRKLRRAKIVRLKGNRKKIMRLIPYR